MPFHFKKRETKEVYTNEETGERVKQEIEGTVAGTLFGVWDFSPDEFTGLQSPSVISETYREDSAGNVTKKMVHVHIIDPNEPFVDGTYLGKDPDPPKGCFISEKYLDTLPADSIWVNDPTYHAKLLDALSYRRLNPDKSAPVPIFGDRFSVDVPGTGEWNKKPQSMWVFTNEQRKQTKEYVNVHGWTTRRTVRWAASSSSSAHARPCHNSCIGHNLWRTRKGRGKALGPRPSLFALCRISAQTYERIAKKEFRVPFCQNAKDLLE